MKKKWRAIRAAVPLAIALLAVLLGLMRLSRPDPKQTALYLGYTDQEPNGWTFETENGPVQPQLGFGGYFEGIAAEDEGPVAASRRLDEDGSRNLLEFGYAGAGIQVFLDGRLIYTDFPNMENRADAFLENVDISEAGQETLILSLPYDCAGKTLRVVTYGPLWDGCRPVIFPSLTSRFSDAVVMSADIVRDIAAMTALALLAIVLLLVFLLGEQAGQRSWKLLLLSVYFLFSAVPLLRQSFAATAAGLSGREPLLNFISLSYVDFLVVFLALHMQGRRRHVLLGACAAHTLLSLGRTLSGLFTFPEGFMQDPAGLMLVVLAVLLMLSQKENRLFWKSAVCVLVISAVMFALWGISRLSEHEALVFLANPVHALLSGDPRAFYRIICMVISVICAAGVVTDFIREYMRRQRQEQVLLLRSRMAQESYAQALDSIRRTAVMRHEWKNQMTSLHLLQKQGRMDELSAQLQALDTHLSRLSPQRYSEHFTINTILQNAASRAENLNIRFHAVAPVPRELPFSDEDLCSLLLNMLDNALEAAAKVGEPDEREVTCAIHERKGYLAIKCENSYSGDLMLDKCGQLQSTKADSSIHGFGLAQMKRVAEKHAGMLDVSYTHERFIVQTALKIC